MRKETCEKMELIEERGANPNREGENPRNGNNSTNSISGAKLLKGVKKTNSNEEILPPDENLRHEADSLGTLYNIQFRYREILLIAYTAQKSLQAFHSFLFKNSSYHLAASFSVSMAQVAKKTI